MRRFASRTFIKVIVAAAMITLNSIAPSFAAKDNWRQDFDSIVEKKLTAAGFKPFDGISYSFPISDEVLGIVQIYDQNLFDDSRGQTAIINTRAGAIDYRLNQLQYDLCDHWFTGPQLWQPTVGSAGSDSSGITVKLVVTNQAQTLVQMEDAVSQLVSKIQKDIVPSARAKFKTTNDIKNFVVTAKYPNDQLYCTAFAATGDIEAARKKADWISANIGTARVNKLWWSKFKPGFDKWIKSGAKLPDLSGARAKVLDAAARRLYVVSNTPAEERPPW